MLSISSRNKVPPLDVSTRPICSSRPCAAARHVAEHFALRDRLGQGAAIDRDERPAPPRAGAVESVATSSFPLPVSPSTRTSISAAATWRDRVAQASHRPGCRRSAGCRSAAARGGAQRAGCPAPAGASPARVRIAAIKMIGREGLGQEIERALLQRAHRHRHIGMAGDQDDRDVRIHRADRGEQLSPSIPGMRMS